MKILLVGEYNRTHYNLKKALNKLGHEALVIGTEDGFKKVDVDIVINNPFNSYLLKKIRSLIYRVFKIDLLSVYTKNKIKSNKHLLSNYDVVQYINESPFLIDRKGELAIFKLFNSWNKKSFLLSTGTDYISVSYAFDKKFRYSILTPLFEGKVSKKDFSPALNYLSKSHKTLHDYIVSKISGIISKDLDYHIPLLDHPKYLGMIPHAIDVDSLEYKKPVVKDKVVIFHGINTNNYYKKGNDIFDAALEIISKKYTDKVDIITVKDLPYKAYIESFNKAHILLDQVYAYDQGFNALEAMAKGIVVFTGAEKEWLEYYNVQEDTIAINALPNEVLIAEKLEWLINNPEVITEISLNARQFVEQHHNYINCAKSYLDKWS